MFLSKNLRERIYWKNQKIKKEFCNLMKLLGTTMASMPNFYYIVYDMISYRLRDFYNILYYIILYYIIYIWEYLVFVTHTHCERGEDF